MFFEIIIALFFGIFCGIFTGLAPGIHINLISVMLVGMSGYLLGFVQKVTLGAFIIAMGITHTFLDNVPSVFLGAPDADKALLVLPGHRLLLEGKGYEAVKLATMGSYLGLVLDIILIPLFIPFMTLLDGAVSPYIGFILLAAALVLIWMEDGYYHKTWAAIIFLISGILGIIVLNGLDMEQPLLPMLSGLFGISTLFMSLFEKTNIPEQKMTETISIAKKRLAKIVSVGTFTGSISGFFPGLGSAQAAIMASSIIKEKEPYDFIVLVGAIGTVNFVFSLAAMYALNKARNGAIVAVLQILKTVSYTETLIFLCTALVAGSIALFLALWFAKVFAKIVSKVDYQKMSIGVMILVALIVFYFTSWIGMLILVVSSAVGMLPSLTGVKKSTAMGCLLLPVILYFLL